MRTEHDEERGLLGRFAAPLRWALAAAALLGLVLLAVEALARAGGGGNYSGGGGGFGGGGGGGDADGIVALVWLAIAYPEIGVPLLVVAVVVVVVKRAMNPDRRTRNAVKKLEEIGGRSTADLGRLTERDPAFDPAKFLERATKLDAAVQDAWCRGRMDPVRTMLSDGLVRRFEAQLSIMRHQGVRNAMADHRVLDARIHAVEHDESFDTLHVAFQAQSRDVEVDARLGFDEAAALAAKAKVETYTEIWSFLRRPGARTLAAGGAMEGQCPSCGAPLPAGQATRCDHCKALVNSGEHDWVLAEITQPIEWRPSSTGAVPGMDQLRAADPGFSRQGAEDRASYVFWRWVEALVLGKGDPLAKCATAGFRQQVAGQAGAGPAALFKTAVGSVDLLACEPGAPGGRDRFHAKILWSSARSNAAQPAPAANVVTLSRKQGATGGDGLSYARCGVCQGPLAENDSPRCEYCGADLAAGDAEWVLEAVIRPEELMAVRAPAAVAAEGDDGDAALPAWATPDMGNPRERRLLLMRMAAVVMADGQVTKAERKLLSAASKRWQVPMEVVEPILSGEVDPGEVATMRPSNPTGFLTGLIAAALIDGRIDSKEEKLLLDVGRGLSFSDADTRNLMNAARKTMKMA